MAITWNYRVFLEDNSDYIIREVFYSETGAIVGCSENAIEPWGESLEELTQNLAWFQEALSLPVLTLADIPEQPVRSTQKSDRSENISHDRLMAELGLAESSPTN